MQRIRASINYPLSGAPGLMTLYTHDPIAENSATADICNARLNDAVTAGAALFNTNVTIVGDSFVDTIDPATGVITSSDGVTSWTVTGLNGTDPLPPATAVVLSFSTDDIVNGRRVRGRAFVSPLSAAVLGTGGTLIGADLTVAQDMATSWWDAGLTGTVTVVWHRPVGGSGGSIHPITGSLVKNKFGVLRSRRD